jgi:hypothetical protein
MRVKSSWALGGLAAALALAPPATASADFTLGSIAEPYGATSGTCVAGYFHADVGSDPSTPYAVPAGGGVITQWETNTIETDTAGAKLTFVVLAPSGSNYSVVAADPETLPTPLPASGVATFTLPTPIAVTAGDLIGLYTVTAGQNCAWFGGDTPSGDVLVGGAAAAPTPGETFTPAGPEPGYAVNVSATLVQPQDVVVATSAGPSGVAAGHPALLSSTVTNAGPGSGRPITFVDSLPAGLTIDSVAAGDGSCSTSGQTVTCTIALPAGQNAPVDVVVTPSAAGSYTNTVSVGVTTPVTDPNLTNNAASATLTVGLVLPAQCVVPNLKGISSGFAKKVLTDLGCKVKSKKSHSKSVKKGSVVETKPGKGTYTYQRTITLVVSSGPTKKTHK